MLIAELGNDFIPVSRVARDSRGDPAAARAGKDARGCVVADGIEAPFDEGGTSSMSGTGRARFPLVPLSMRPPGPGVVCRRTVQVHASRSMSAHRTPDTSPIRAAVQAAKMTTSPQPSK